MARTFWVIKTYPHDAVEIKSFATNKFFKVNGYRVKHFYDGDQVYLMEENQLEDP